MGGNDIRKASGDITTEVALVLYPGAQQACIHGLTDLFAVANRLADRGGVGTAPLRISHWRAEPGDDMPVRAYDTLPGGMGTPAVVIAPPCLGEAPPAEAAAPFVPWLRDVHRAGAIVGSVCAGAFVLGEAGLLDGRTVTTHWAHVEPFRARFPAARLDVDKLVVDDGDILTAGGVMAWTDLGLKLVDRFLGPTVMVETARLLLIDLPGREQRFYSPFAPRLTHGDAAVLKVQHWLQANGARPVALAEMAECAGLEPRTFLRRFRKATGLTATHYCQRLRVGKACELLQFGMAPVETIAWQVGYGDPGAFRKVFHRVVGLTPGQYRDRFHAGKSSE
jgi:transcriptional regulator GlxA family with amidase domain